MTDAQILPTNTVKNVWGLGKENLVLTSRPWRPSTGWKIALVIVKRYDFMVQFHTMLQSMSMGLESNHGDCYCAVLFRTSADDILPVISCTLHKSVYPWEMGSFPCPDGKSPSPQMHFKCLNSYVFIGGTRVTVFWGVGGGGAELSGCVGKVASLQPDRSGCCL